MKYPQSILSAYENGCVMDMQLRIAVELLKAKPTLDPSAALDLVEALFAEAEKRDLIAELPKDGKIDEALMYHAERQVALQMHQNATIAQLQSRAGAVKR
jgi:hypothetical protein